MILVSFSRFNCVAKSVSAMLLTEIHVKIILKDSDMILINRELHVRNILQKLEIESGFPEYSRICKSKSIFTCLWLSNRLKLIVGSSESKYKFIQWLLLGSYTGFVQTIWNIKTHKIWLYLCCRIWHLTDEDWCVAWFLGFQHLCCLFAAKLSTRTLGHWLVTLLETLVRTGSVQLLSCNQITMDLESIKIKIHRCSALCSTFTHCCQFMGQ